MTADLLQAGEWAIVTAARVLANDRQAMVTSVSVTFSAAPGGAAHEQIRLAEWEAARRGLDVDAELTAHSVTVRFHRLPCSRRQHCRASAAMGFRSRSRV